MLVSNDSLSGSLAEPVVKQTNERFQSLKDRTLKGDNLFRILSLIATVLLLSLLSYDRWDSEPNQREPYFSCKSPLKQTQAILQQFVSLAVSVLRIGCCAWHSQYSITSAFIKCTTKSAVYYLSVRFEMFVRWQRDSFSEMKWLYVFQLSHVFI